MTGFPNLPFTRGETDDDASIHLYSRIGPAQPIMKSKYDQQIMSMLNKSYKASKNEMAHNDEELNKNFRDFIHNHNSLSEYEIDDIVVENESPVKIGKIMENKKSTIATDHRKQKLLVPRWMLMLTGFFMGVAIIICTQLWDKKIELLMLPSKFLSIDSRLQEVEENVHELHNLTVTLDHQIDSSENKHYDALTSLRHDVDRIEDSLAECINSVSRGRGQYEALQTEIAKSKISFDVLQTLGKSPKELEKRFSEISDRLELLKETSNNLQEIKNEIIGDLLIKLPEYVPIYIKNNKIQYIPEFYHFLEAFVKKYGSNTSQDWKSFIEANRYDFQVYVQTLVQKSHIEFIAKSEFEEMLEKKLAMLNDTLISQYIEMGRNFDPAHNASTVLFSKVGNEIVLGNLLELINKGSIKVNYADHNLGSRILGFLTTTGKDTIRHRSFVRTLFFGWYDYISSHRLRAPKRSKHNANNILFDGGEYWQCEANWCAVGVRLSSSIILTDIVLNNPSTGRPKKLYLPAAISIYIRPRSKRQALALEKILGPVPVGPKSSVDDNKYLSKFYKVVDTQFQDDNCLEHIKIPMRVVDLQIPIRDMFVRIESKQGNTGLYNLKAYGLTESHAKQYTQDFDSLLGKIHHTTRDSKSDARDFDHQEIYILDDDECI